jgi:uncharacterized protein YfcZ (UPF0381/DUF406 family)
MIGIIFQQGTDVIEVRVQDLNLFFRTSQNQQFADITGIRLDKEGCIKEFPELKDNENWKEETIKRLKEKLKAMETEKERAKYIISDLNKHGYIPKFWQQSGYRPVKL